MLPELSGHRGLPDHPRRVRRADRHAHGQGLRARQGRRARARCRRLRHQAVQPARADRPDPGALPARRAGRRGRRRRRRSSTSGASRSTSAATGCCATATPCRSSRRRSSCSRSCSATRARCSPATSCSSTSGATTTRGETRTVDVHVHWLRSEIEADPATPAFIHTVRGVGYVFRRPGADRWHHRSHEREDHRPARQRPGLPRPLGRPRGRRSSPACARRPRATRAP